MLSLPLLLKALRCHHHEKMKQWRENKNSGEERDDEEATIARPNTSNTITVYETETSLECAICFDSQTTCRTKICEKKTH